MPLGPDEQVLRTIFDIARSARGISYQVKNDLLDLNSIASDGRKIPGKIGAQNHTVSLKSTRRQSNRFS